MGDGNLMLGSSEEWNESVPVGAPVRYWSVLGHPGFIDSATRSKAWDLGGHTPVVMIDGVSGGVAVEHLRVLSPAMPTVDQWKLVRLSDAARGLREELEGLGRVGHVHGLMYLDWLLRCSEELYASAKWPQGAP